MWARPPAASVLRGPSPWSLQGMFYLPVSVSTTDLATVNLQAELRSRTKEALAVLGALLPLGSPQRLLLSHRRA